MLARVLDLELDLVLTNIMEGAHLTPEYLKVKSNIDYSKLCRLVKFCTLDVTRPYLRNAIVLGKRLKDSIYKPTTFCFNMRVIKFHINT